MMRQESHDERIDVPCFFIPNEATILYEVSTSLKCSVETETDKLGMYLKFFKIAYCHYTLQPS